MEVIVNLFFEVLTVACSALMIAELLPFIEMIKTLLNKARLKPLDCALCLSTWFGMAYSLVFAYPIKESIAITSIAPVVAIIISYLIRKLQN